MGRRQIRTGRRPAPLPVRDGLNPSRIRLPADGNWDTVVDYLRHRFPAHTERLADKLALGEVVDSGGTPISSRTPYSPDGFVYLYRDPVPEPVVPFEAEILFRDGQLLVIDKPHFLSTTPRGNYITESALVRLRRQLDLPDLSPLHRLDRATAGVVVFSLNRLQRGAYQTLFAHREVTKIYRAVAPIRPELTFPMEVANRLRKDRGTPVTMVVEGEPNAHTRIDLLDTRGELGLYELRPSTGKTHQLRVHLAGLGIPILGDPFYPALRDVDREDYSDPLQLLAFSIAFTDPITGQPRHFSSRRHLDSWPWHRDPIPR